MFLLYFRNDNFNHTSIPIFLSLYMYKVTSFPFYKDELNSRVKSIMFIYQQNHSQNLTFQNISELFIKTHT